MLKLIALPAVVAILMAAPGTPSPKSSTQTPTSGSWQVDSRNSDAELITDGLTNYRTTKINFTLGYGRIEGAFKLDDSDAANSRIDFRFYPANSTSSPIGEDGTLRHDWLANPANQTLVCFHSKKIVRMPDGKLQVTGDLVVTRVDHNVALDPNEAYSGPIYGPPMVHRTVRDASFIFDAPVAAGKKQKDGLKTSGVTSISREGYPELVRTAIGTYWPTLAQGEPKCWNPAGGTEDYRGFQCTGTYMSSSGPPPAPGQIGEDYPGPQNFNTVVGKQLTIMIHLRLKPKATT